MPFRRPGNVGRAGADEVMKFVRPGTMVDTGSAQAIAGTR